MDQNRLEGGISTYSHEQELLLRLIKRKGGSISSIEFDRIFFQAKWKPRFRMNGDSIILSPMSFGQHNKWLHLLKLMVATGRINYILESLET
jgi:hypothetical protein